MKRLFCLGMIFTMLMGTTAWAETEGWTELTAPWARRPEWLIREATTEEAAILPAFPNESYYAFFLKENEPAYRVMYASDTAFELPLEYAPYVNEDGVMMIAAQDIYQMFGVGGPRYFPTEEEINDEREKQLGYPILGYSRKYLIFWNKETGEFKVELDAFRLSDIRSVGTVWINSEDPNEVIEEIERNVKGEVLHPKRFWIEGKVGEKEWSFDGVRNIARSPFEVKNGTIYLPLRDMEKGVIGRGEQRKLLWNGQNRTLAIIGGMRE